MRGPSQQCPGRHAFSLPQDSACRIEKGRRGSTSLSCYDHVSCRSAGLRSGSGAGPATLPAHAQGLPSPLLGLNPLPFLLDGRFFVGPPVLQLPKDAVMLDLPFQDTDRLFMSLPSTFISNCCFSFRRRSHHRRNDRARRRHHHRQIRTGASPSEALPH
jgi:hypothetical protein